MAYCGDTRIPILPEGLLPKKTSMVEFLDGIDNGGCVDIYMENMDLFDFPMESLEGDGLDEGDWDTKLQVLGPIPQEALLDPLTISGGNNGNAISESGDLSDIKLPPKFINETSRGSTPLRKFQTRSPVSVLERGSSCSVEKSFFRMSGVPVRARTKRSRTSTINPWLRVVRLVPLISSTLKGSRHSASSEELSGSNDFSESNFPSKMANPAGWRVKKKKKLSLLSSYNEFEANSSRYPVGKRCTHCQATSTPQWREGPMGPKTLCNACGVRFRSGRLLPEYRPVASPTFIRSEHSNSHRRVVEMRFLKANRKAKVPEAEPPITAPNKAIHEAAVAEAEPLVAPHKAIQEAVLAETEIPPTSPPPEFVPMSSYLFDCVLGTSVQYF